MPRGEGRRGESEVVVVVVGVAVLQIGDLHLEVGSPGDPGIRVVIGIVGGPRDRGELVGAENRTGRRRADYDRRRGFVHDESNRGSVLEKVLLDASGLIFRLGPNGVAALVREIRKGREDPGGLINRGRRGNARRPAPAQTVPISGQVVVFDVDADPGDLQTAFRRDGGAAVGLAGVVGYDQFFMYRAGSDRDGGTPLARRNGCHRGGGRFNVIVKGAHR